MKARALLWQTPVRVSHTFATNAALLTASDGALFIADGDYQLVSVAEVHSVAGDDGGTVSLDIKKCTGAVAPSAGTSMLASVFNLKSTADTVVRKDESLGTLATSLSTRRITKGDRICADLVGTLATLSGMNITLVLRPITKPAVW